MTTLDEECTCRKVLAIGASRYIADIEKGRCDDIDSPIFDLLNVAEKVGLYDVCIKMILNAYFYPKEGWRRTLWQTIWKCKDEDYLIMYKQPKPDTLAFKIIENVYYLVWWLYNLRSDTG